MASAHFRSTGDDLDVGSTSTSYGSPTNDNPLDMPDVSNSLGKFYPEGQTNTLEFRHQPISDEMQSVAKNIHFRLAGHNTAGEPVSCEERIRDYNSVVALNNALVVDPEDVHEQMEVYDELHRAFDGDPVRIEEAMQLNPDSFYMAGGHVSQLTPDDIATTMRDGCVLIIEHIEPDQSVGTPIAYHLAFPELPNYPESLSRESLPDGFTCADKLRENSDKVYTIWRTGVLHAMTDDLRRELEQLSLPVPEQLMSQSFQSLSIGTATKYVAGKVAQELDKEYVTCNIGSLIPVESDAYDVQSIPNRRSEGANASKTQRLFVDMKMNRTVRDSIQLDSGAEVAQIEWKMYGRRPSHLARAAIGEQSALTRKKIFEQGDLDRVAEQMTRYLRHEH